MCKDTSPWNIKKYLYYKHRNSQFSYGIYCISDVLKVFYGFLNICIRFVPIKSTLTVDEVVQLNSQIQPQPEG